MIEIQADLHTHSDLSDGKGTLEENVEAAYRRGLGCIACTEHGPRHMKAGICAAAERTAPSVTGQSAVSRKRQCL
ncbi:MAG: PHP domain-containing protein [Christensenellales bacterium]